MTSNYEPISSSEIIGQFVNNGLYRVLDEIGDGSFSRTFIVEDTFSNTL
jgi:hypothetical protein